MDTPGRGQGRCDRRSGSFGFFDRWCRKGAALALLLATALATAAPAPFDISTLLDWAERSYPQLFPGPQPNQSAPPYVYRHYPQTGNYVGVGNGLVYLLGPVSQGQLQSVGPMAQFECQVLPANCAAVLPRLEVTGTVAVVRDSLGRHLAWGENRTTARTDGTALPGTAMRVLAQGAKQLVVTDYGGFEVKADGRLFAWGAGYWMPGYAQAPFSAPVELKVPGAVAQATQPGLLAFFTAVLLTDGSVWQLPGDSVQVGGLLRFNPRPVQTPARVRSLASALLGNAAYMLLFDGTGWRADLGGGKLLQVKGVTDATQLSCGYSLCAALRSDGRVLTWGVDNNAAAAGAAVVDELSNIRMVSAGGYWLAAIDGAGQLWSTYTLLATALIRPVASFSGATDLACGFSTCVVLKADGSAWGWGDSSSGILGNAVVSSTIATPVRINGVTVP